MVHTSAPDRLETDPVIAWRRWYAFQRHGETRLQSPVLPYTWPPGVRSESRCSKHYFASPHLECKCGFYAVKSRRDIPLRHPTPHVATVVGTVSLWGRVVEHELGYRAQYAYPFSLYVEALPGQECIVRGLIEEYGVDVELVEAPRVWPDRRTILT